MWFVLTAKTFTNLNDNPWGASPAQLLNYGNSLYHRGNDLGRIEEPFIFRRKPLGSLSESESLGI